MRKRINYAYYMICIYPNKIERLYFKFLCIYFECKFFWLHPFFQIDCELSKLLSFMLCHISFKNIKNCLDRYEKQLPDKKNREHFHYMSLRE